MIKIRNLKAFLFPINILYLVFPFSNDVTAQNCACDHVLSPSDVYIDAHQMDITPGDTICIQAGKRSHLNLMNFQGSREQPLVFINCGGKVIIQNDNLGYGFKFQNGKHFKVTGSGVEGMKYGIKIAGTQSGASALQIGDLSSDFEVEFLEIANAGFAGIMAKTDFRCDGSANRGNFFMKNVHLHDNYIHDVGGEGMYIGNSFYSGKTTQCQGKDTTLYPHDIIGLRIYNNKVKNTDWDGIQVGCASEDTKIYNNTITGYGLSGRDAHTNGLQIGEGTTGKVYNNLIRDGRGNGIILLGLGNNVIFNNLIIRPGGYGIFCDDRVTKEGSQMAFINNTIVNPEKGGIMNYSEVTENKYYNNLITGINSDITFGQGTTGEIKNNLVGINQLDPASRTSKYFNNVLKGDYSLKASSPAVDAGMDVSSYGVSFDFNFRKRPAGKGFDIGAFEYGARK